ncbi:phage tail protein [Paenibacillus macerans]|uniref:phage tail protein n=1 Tax=Paenibacillus macerans TaxID=44252 RepID=UPI003D31B6EC
MATNTPNLNLLKKDPVTDGNETFNIQTMLNDNWDKIDAAVGDIDIPDASLTVKGKVQLSNAIDGTREDVAATERAVKAVSDNLAAHLADIAQEAQAAKTAGNERKQQAVDALIAWGVSASMADSWGTLFNKMAAITNRGAQVITPGTTNKTILAGIHNGNGYVIGDADLVAGNIPDDVNIFGVQGSLKRLTATDKTAIANQITEKGVVASVDDSPATLASKIGQIIPQPVMAAGNNMIYNSWVGYWYDVTYYGSNWAKVHTIKIGLKGTYRVKFGLYAFNSQVAYGQIYKNGVAYGAQRANGQYEVNQYYTEDIYFNVGDTLELWVRNSGSGGARYAIPVLYGSLIPYAISEPAPSYPTT